MVNYLILTMLEAVDWNDLQVRIPASLNLLIREQLCGANPDLHAQYKSINYQQNIGISAGKHFQRTGEQISARKLAKAFLIPKSTAARWLADKKFLGWVELGREMAREKMPKLIDKRCPTK